MHSASLRPVASAAPNGKRIGRYALYGEIARGGMATVHFGRLIGSAGFARTVAIKRLHPHLAKEPDFVKMFLDESRLAGRIHHPNVVQTLDVVSLDDEIFLVMEYLQGESLSRLAKTAVAQGGRVPVPLASAVLAGALHGLHAAHEARDEQGARLDVVHRDVSPHNILVGVDGVSRVIDFGVAKAAGRLQMTIEGHVKGKVAYMAPEQLSADPVDHRTDIYAAGTVLWEMLTGRPLFDGESQAAVIAAVLLRPVPPPSSIAPEVPAALDAVVLRALDRKTERRFATAHDMALAIEAAVPVASATQVGEWVTRLAGEATRERARIVGEIERGSGSLALTTWCSESEMRALATRGTAPGGIRAPEPSGARLAKTEPSRTEESSADAVTTSGASQAFFDRGRSHPSFRSESGTLSRPSSISLLPDPPDPGRASRDRLRRAVAITTALLLAFTVVAFSRHQLAIHHDAAAIKTPPATVAVAPPSLQTSSPTVTDAVVHASPPFPTSPPPPSPSPAPPPPAPRSSAPVAVQTIPVTALPVARPSEKAKHCSVNSYIDESGFTQFVKECK